MAFRTRTILYLKHVLESSNVKNYDKCVSGTKWPIQTNRGSARATRAAAPIGTCALFAPPLTRQVRNSTQTAGCLPAPVAVVRRGNLNLPVGGF